MSGKHDELVARLEAAEAGSRELDGAVWYAVFEPDVEHGSLHVEQTEQGPREVLTCELGSKWADDVGPYTTSLDAALALAERVLPGWSWTLHSPRDPVAPTDNGRPWFSIQNRADLPRPNEGRFSGVGATPALCVCISILRATGASQ